MIEKLKYGLAVNATGYFECDKPIGWDDWPATKQAEYFFDNAGPLGKPCCHCSDKIETDCEPTADSFVYLLEEIEHDKSLKADMDLEERDE